MSFKALETRFGALETDFRHYNQVLRRISIGHSGLKLGYDWQEARPTASVGLAKSTTGVGLDPRPVCV